MLRIFYESVVASTILYAVGCWAAGWGWWIPTDSTNWFKRPVMLWEWSVTLWWWFQRGRCWLSYGRSWTVSHTHFMMCTWSVSTFSERLIPPKCMTEHRRKSFLTVAIKLCNSSLWMVLGLFYSLRTFIFILQFLYTIHFLSHLFYTVRLNVYCML